jgi:ribonuclease HI
MGRYASIELPSRTYVPVIRATEIITQSGRLFQRFVNDDDPSEVVVFADGKCQNNGSPNATAEFIVVHRPYSDTDVVDFNIPIIAQGMERSRPLKPVAITGETCYPTSSRAKLQAAITALQIVNLEHEGFTSIVVACDLRYVVSGITSWVGRWRVNDWCDAKGREVANVDLFKALLSRIRFLQKHGFAVYFMESPRLKGPRRQ